MNKKYFIGLRDNDIEHSRHYFDGSVTVREIIGSVDWNDPRTDALITNFFSEQVQKLSKINDKFKVMYYNPEKSHMVKHPSNCEVMCVNELHLTKEINNKVTMRDMFNGVIPMLDYVVTKGKYINCSAGDVVIHESITLAGAGVYFMSKEFEEQVKKMLDPEKYYSVSQFYPNNLPLNIHCMIGEHQIELFAPRSQNISMHNHKFNYMGVGENLCLSKSAIGMLCEYSTSICKVLQKRGYRGVCGIDYIMGKEKLELYFMEVNPRFQASTSVVDGLLLKSGLPSIYEYNEMAFAGKEMPSVKQMEGWYNER